MDFLKTLCVLLATSLASCASVGSEPEDFGGNPVSVEITIAASNASSPEGSSPIPVRGWVLNAPGLLEIGGRDRLTEFETLREQEGDATVEAARNELIADLNKYSLHQLNSSIQSVMIEPKLHTLVVEDGDRLRHAVIQVVTLQRPYSFKFEL